MSINKNNPTIGILLPPSTRGPGMIKSFPLDVAHLIAWLRKDGMDNIRLIDFRIHAINGDNFWQAKGVDLKIFNDFKRCIDHILIKEDPGIKKIAVRILKEIDWRDIKYILFSVSVLEQFSLKYFITSVCVAKELKALRPDVRILFFGSAPQRHMKRIMTKFTFVDAFLEDGSEHSAVEYINNPELKKPLSGLSYREKGELIFSPSRKHEVPFNEFPIPDFSLFDKTQYQWHGQIVLPYEINRGCSKNCFYCYFTHKNSLSYKDIGRVVRDLEILSEQYKTNAFHFVDGAINSDEVYLEKLCVAFAEKLQGIKWSAMARPNMDYRLLQKMRAAGCVQIRWGVEYGSDRMLKKINKDTSPDTIRTTLKNAYALGIYNYVTFLTGVKIETDDDITQTKELIGEIHPYLDAANECIYGELGSFDIDLFDHLLDGKAVAPPSRERQYDQLFKRYNIPMNPDIIETIIGSRPSVIFLVAPNDTFPMDQKEGEGDDKIPHREIFSTISYLKSIKDLKIDYFNFPALMTHTPSIYNFFSKRISRDLSKNIFQLIRFMTGIIRKYDYYVFYIPLWNENVKISLLLARTIKKMYPLSKNIFLGPCCNLYPDEISKHPFVDFVITDEPETAVKDIVLGKDKTAISNIAYRVNGAFQANPERGLELSKKDFNLDYSLYFDFIKKYNLPTPPFLYFELSRGCIFRCFFCSLTTNFKLRAKTIDFSLQELGDIVRSTGIKNIFFNDNELNFNKVYLNKFLDALISSKLNLTWTSYMVAKDVDYEVLRKMRTAGCVFLRWGLESVNPEKQKIISKHLDPDEVSRILEMSSSLGIKNQISFSIGYPYDGEIDRTMAIDFIERNHQSFHCVNLNRFYPRRKSLSHLHPQEYGIRIISDNLYEGRVVFEEINGLDWYLKNEQQLYYQRSISEKLYEYNLKDSDPELFFIRLIGNNVPIEAVKICFTSAVSFRDAHRFVHSACAD